MKITVIADNKVLDTKLTTFSDGAISFELLSRVAGGICNLNVKVDAKVNEVCWVARLVAETLMDHLPRAEHTRLVLDYFPNARADRPFNDNMVSVKRVFLEAIDQICFYDEISTLDVHSPVYNIDYCLDVISHSPSITPLVDKCDVVVAPDAGAVDRVIDLGKPYVTASKTRDLETGYIKEYVLPENADVKGKDCLIVDDICDGGRTFLMCAEALKARGAKSVALYVTHGIFSRGTSALRTVLDEIHCHHIVGDYIKPEELDSVG